MATVRYRGVGKRFADGTEALADFDLHVRDREFMVLVGPSGCGKSTALRLLAGLETASAGELLIDDVVINGVPAQQRNIAMVFQNYALYPHMSVRHNLEFPLRMMKLPCGEIERRTAWAADLLQLDELLERLPKQLSGGQRQRVAMGRAIVREPRVFLMDEPLSNLDARLRVQIRTGIAALQQRLNITTIYVTHDQTEAMTLGQRVAVMHAGRLQQVDAPQMLYARPANTFVAGFVGSPGMNIFASRLRRKGAGLECSFAGQWLPLPAGGMVKHEALLPYVDQEILAGLRPEAFDLAAAGEASVALPLTAVEILGHEQLLYFDMDRQPATQLIARLRGAATVKPGSLLPLRIDMGQVHFFTAQGEALYG